MAKAFSLILLTAPIGLIHYSPFFNFSSKPRDSFDFSAIVSATADMVFDHLTGFKVSLKIVLESGNIELMQELVSQVNGVTVLAGVAVKYDLNNKRVRALRILECARP
ncbi:MAG: hypothetical protein JSW56_17805 [Deltaproteobacteria bacterium]|nr:MAG: hypothetical protein JSW56_17805 [Deltaproteobacteria bacterium]